MVEVNANYQARDIVVLEGLDAVRRRPAMYIGGTDSTGLHHLLWEIVDNAVDEVMEGFAHKVEVTLADDGRTVTVVDDGRGIPVDKHPKFQKSALELVMTTLHAGGKFDKQNYATSTGLHGVGASVVNALSTRLEAEVRRDGATYRQVYERGRAQGPVRKVGSSKKRGTTVTFSPDEEIFGPISFDPAVIRQALEDRAYLFRDLTIRFNDQVNNETHLLHHPEGIAAFLEHLRQQRNVKPAAPMIQVERDNGIRVEAALVWTEATNETIRSYANGVHTPHGGTHESGFRAGVAKALRNHIAVHNWKPAKGLTISNEDIREGLMCVLSVFLPEPQFQGQTKARLNNAEMNAAVDGAVRQALEQWLNENPSHAETILTRVQIAARARAASREAAKGIRTRSAVARRLNLPGKLADCSSTDPRLSELFIVEGDSAGGSAKQGRDRKHQAILPLRGKVLNTQQASSAKVAQNKELGDLVRALGCGMGANFDETKLRYHRIILLMDADSDGNHIATLLLTFFLRHLPQLILKGYVFLAQPPLYRIDVGNKTYWALDDDERDQVLSSLKSNAKPVVQRFKGLGEMPPATLKETTLDPARRTLLQVDVSGEGESDTRQTFEDLMGSDPKPRYDFLIGQAGLATADELDV
jgi:DNA gyrase subunit B/topoisomerase-4 subunit B